MEVTAIHFRNKPILLNALMSDVPEGYTGIIRSAGIWDDLDKLGIPGIRGVYAVPVNGARSLIVVALEQRYAGHAQQVLALVAQCPAGAHTTKWIVTVDEDVDPSDLNQVLWAMATRCNPIDDIDIQRNTWSTWLDPTQNPPEKRPYASKAMINACKEHRNLPVFSKRTRLRRETYERVVARWQELGLPGRPPAVLSFEEESAQLTFHESQDLSIGNRRRGPKDEE